MAITSSFLKANGLLTTLGDAIDNTILISRDAAGTIQVNGGAVPVLGGQMVPVMRRQENYQRMALQPRLPSQALELAREQ